ncbi:MAG: hypothetical protein GF364_12185, partial [Candidatus Lokiarchaeota archaeon]|nr:hypothetical protein [Candidatus Lokiarchaeota archaeon]
SEENNEKPSVKEKVKRVTEKVKSKLKTAIESEEFQKFKKVAKDAGRKAAKEAYSVGKKKAQGVYKAYSAGPETFMTTELGPKRAQKVFLTPSERIILALIKQSPMQYRDIENIIKTMHRTGLLKIGRGGKYVIPEKVLEKYDEGTLTRLSDLVMRSIFELFVIQGGLSLHDVKSILLSLKNKDQLQLRNGIYSSIEPMGGLTDQDDYQFSLSAVHFDPAQVTHQDIKETINDSYYHFCLLLYNEKWAHDVEIRSKIINLMKSYINVVTDIIEVPCDEIGKDLNKLIYDMSKDDQYTSEDIHEIIRKKQSEIKKIYGNIVDSELLLVNITQTLIENCSFLLQCNRANLMDKAGPYSESAAGLHRLLVSMLPLIASYISLSVKKGGEKGKEPTSGSPSRIYLPISIDGNPTEIALLDTGSPITIIDQSYQKRLGWEDNTLTLTYRLHDFHKPFTLRGKNAFVSVPEFNVKKNTPIYIYDGLKRLFDVPILIGVDCIFDYIKPILESKSKTEVIAALHSAGNRPNTQSRNFHNCLNCVHLTEDGCVHPVAKHRFAEFSPMEEKLAYIEENECKFFERESAIGSLDDRRIIYIDTDLQSYKMHSLDVTESIKKLVLNLENDTDFNPTDYENEIVQLEMMGLVRTNRLAGIDLSTLPNLSETHRLTPKEEKAVSKLYALETQRNKLNTRDFTDKQYQLNMEYQWELISLAFKNLIGITDDLQPYFPENADVDLFNLIENNEAEIEIELSTTGSIFAQNISYNENPIQFGSASIEENIVLYNYQISGVNWLCNRRQREFQVDVEYNNQYSDIPYALLADDMGTGKTFQVIAYISRRLNNGLNNPYKYLIVAPSILLNKWEDDIKRCVDNIDFYTFRSNASLETFWEQVNTHNVVLTSYALLRLHYKELFSYIKWEGIFFDEVDKLKDLTSDNLLASMNLTANFRVGITGTPIRKNLIDLISIFMFLTRNSNIADIFTLDANEEDQRKQEEDRLLNYVNWNTLRRAIDDQNRPFELPEIHYPRTSNGLKYRMIDLSTVNFQNRIGTLQNQENYYNSIAGDGNIFSM